MITAILLTAISYADDLEVHVKVPGAEPVWATIRNVEAGSTHRVEFPGIQNTSYVLALDVESGDVGYDWQIAFDLSSVRHRSRGRSDSQTLAAPTMRSHTNELAQYVNGSTKALEGSEPQVQVFHGYQIEWIVRPSEPSK